MIKKTRYKKSVIISAIVVLSLVLLIFITQLILGFVITNKVKNALNNSKNEHYHIQIEKAKVNLFTMSLILKGINLTPDSLAFADMNEGKIPGPLYKLDIPALRIRNIGVLRFIDGQYIDIGEIILKKSKVNIYLSGIKKEPETKNTTNHRRLNSDSLQIKGVSGGVLNYLKLSQITIHIIDNHNGDTMFIAPNIDLELDKFTLEKNQDSTYKLTLGQFNFELRNERFHLPGNKYLLLFDYLSYNKNNAILQIKDLTIKPRYTRKQMISFSPYQYEIYDVKIKDLQVNHLLLGRAARDSGVFVKNVLIDGMVLDIFKDKLKPFDESKRPKLPHELLRSLNFDLFVDSINIHNSKLIYAEKHKLVEELMHVELDDLEVDIENVTSITDSIISGTVMEISLRANIQNSIPMGVDIYFPMKSVSDTFYFSGFMRSGDMKKFNNVLLPALGITFEDGYLDDLEFWASANPSWSIGEMTMKYHDLQGNVRKQDMVNQNKFLSWAANQLIMKNNPSNNKAVRTVPMYFERVEYKGMGNFLWKTLQSGILATVIPTISGRVQGEIDRKVGTSKADIKKREREKRKAEKEFKKKQKKKKREK